jgi:MFS family permease
MVLSYGVMSAPDEESILHRTVRISTAEGVYSQVFTTVAGPGSIFLTKFALFLGATPFQFSLLAAIGQLSQIFQPLGYALTRQLTSRKGVVVKLTAIGRVLVFLLGAIPFLLYGEPALQAFLFIFLASASLQAVGGNAWIAWITDIIPERMRGRFFSWRFQALLVAGLVTGFVLGAFIDLYEPEPGFVADKFLSLIGHWTIFSPQNIAYAFALVFIVAGGFGLVGAKVLSTQPEHPKPREQAKFMPQLIAPLRDRNFRRLLLYSLWWMLAIGIGAPFWGPFMLKNLRMSLVNIQIYAAVSAIASLSALRFWGRLIDRFGNKPVMRIILVLGAINPIIWVFLTPDNYWFIYVEAASSGIMWSGAGIVATNLVLSLAPKEQRQIYSGLFGAFSGLAVVVTMLLSGICLPPAVEILSLSLSGEQVLFGISGLTRLTAQIPLSWIEEPRTRSVGAVLNYFLQFTKVQITQFAVWIFRRNGRR